MAHPKIGNLAPNFSLLNQSGEKVSLKDYRGHKKVVLYFYPKASTPGCTVQACEARNAKADFDAVNAIVIGVSPDPVKKIERFHDRPSKDSQETLNFDLLSDEGHKLAEKYGVWALKKFMGKESMGIVRTTFIIDEDGKLCKIMDLKDFKTKTHHQVVLDYIHQNM